MTPDLLRAATGCSAALADRYAVPLAGAVSFGVIKGWWADLTDWVAR